MHLAFHTTPTWTLKGRVQTITKSNQSGYYPGPFDYQTEKKTQRSPTFVIGKAPRQVFKVKQTLPGPGAYEFRSTITEGFKKSLAGRLDYPIKNSPGPQDYNNDSLRIKHKLPEFSMSKRSKSYREIVYDNNLYKPAPTAYQTKGSFNNPKGLIGTSVRKDLTQTQKTPGPGTYLTMDVLNKTQSLGSTLNPRCSIGTNPRNTAITKIHNNPGPGTYQRKTFWQQNKSSGKGYTLRPHTTDLQALQKKKLPGPGYYDINLNNKSKAPEYKTGTNQRLTFIDQATKSYSNLPPPGSHNFNADLKFRTTSSFKFGHSNRRQLDQHQKTPGPAYYIDKKTKILNQAPKFSLSRSQTRLDQYLTPKDSYPSPNLYEPQIKLVIPSIKTSEVPHDKQRPDYQKAKYTPGPGFYNLNRKQQGPTWKFGSELRRSFVQQKQSSRVPGVGEYAVDSPLPNAPKYMNTSSKINFDRRLSK